MILEGKLSESECGFDLGFEQKFGFRTSDFQTLDPGLFGGTRTGNLNGTWTSDSGLKCQTISKHERKKIVE